MTDTFLRKLILGKHPFIPSHTDYKRVMMTGQLCTMTITICIVFAIMDMSYSVFNGIPIHMVCATVAFISLALNRRGHHKTAKILLAIAVNFTVYVFSESEPREVGLYLFFVVSSIGSVAAFGFEDRKMAIVFVSLSMALFMLSLLSDIIILPKFVGTHDYITFNIFANVLLSTIASTMIVYFLIKLNYRSEQALIENERLMIIKNEELTKLNAELDRFVYSTSHDLRSPISSALGLIQLAKMTNDPVELKNYMEMMEGCLASLNKFIKDISDYSRNARSDVDLQPVLVQTMIHNILENLKFYPGIEKMKITVDVENNFEFITDPTRLHIILSNLISNSFKYVDRYKENPFIKVSAKLNATHVELKVEDNGVGIHEDYIPKIFDMFFQAQKKSEGSGLGLYIVKEAVMKLNGTIEVISKLDMGSRFNVSLPVNVLTNKISYTND